ncbi:Retrovirus-related Pol polyprotein from type-1 retrotransposable element R1 [Eumeta japonica]|uniref:Retrovirus-related Pol polyprotein from type-1 retrotransposable element R1 n=1 Tax=Eumeta variegata TaxID=151549 RepID=A0A4C2A7H0_EUMVA|nr:Retrovirus-related Pol polyprotein from type-1 retrotransposable element R1 [Eumeta japonica]
MKVDDNVEKLLAEISSTKEILGRVDVSEKLEEISRVAVAKPAPRSAKYAEAVAKPKLTIATAKTSGPAARSETSHTLIVALKFKIHTAEQVIIKLRKGVDTREMGMAVDRIRKARGQKVVVRCSSVEDANRIKNFLKIRETPNYTHPRVLIGKKLEPECIQQAYDATISCRNSKCGQKPPWWSPKLEEVKRDTRTKKLGIRNGAPSRREYVVGEYVQAKEVYERAVAEAQTSWKRFCSAQDGENLWDGIFRVISETGKNRQDVLLLADSGQVLGPNESVTLLAEIFFPDDRVYTDDLYRMEAPGIDEFESDKCQAAIFRELGLFLAMANKCLELGYFPRTWKVAAIKLIPKPEKEDYTRTKSYRPIDRINGVIGYGECLRISVEVGAEDPAAHSKLPSRPQWHDLGLPLRSGGYRQVRWRGVQKKDFQGLYTSLYSRSNLLESDFELPAPRRRGTRRLLQAFADDVVLIFSGRSDSAVGEDTNRALTHVQS